MGLYEYGRSVNDYKHYESINYELPMTLSLFNVEDDKVQKVFAWMPDKDQWWITGFNPHYTEPVPENMTTIYSVDFSAPEYSSMYFDFKNLYRSEFPIDIIFDDDLKMIWTVW